MYILSLNIGVLAIILGPTCNTLMAHQWCLAHGLRITALECCTVQYVESSLPVCIQRVWNSFPPRDLEDPLRLTSASSHPGWGHRVFVAD